MISLIEPISSNITNIHLNSNASGILSLLDEEDSHLKLHALEKLALIVDNYWSEVADSISIIETLAEDEMFNGNQIASYIASKVYFHLGEYTDSLRLALNSGNYFNINQSNNESKEYIQTLTSTCIDQYISLRNNNNNNNEINHMNTKIENVIEKIFEKCINNQNYKEAIGIALEAKRLDKITNILNNSNQMKNELLSYTLDICNSTIVNQHFKMEVVNTILQVYQQCKENIINYSKICHCYEILNKPKEAADILLSLIKNENDINQTLLAYQIAFDFLSNENFCFLSFIKKKIDSTEELNEKINEKKKILVKILSNEYRTNLYLDFLSSKSQSDPLLITTIKKNIDICYGGSRLSAVSSNSSSIIQNAVIISHCYLNYGTLNDSFLRNNLEYMGKASYWSKFTTTASIGVIHKGISFNKSKILLGPYLPTDGGLATNVYSEGGSLFAMGLIHTDSNHDGNNDDNAISYLRNSLKNAGNNETVLHGACLGLALVKIGSYNVEDTNDSTEIFNELMNVIYTDSAVPGESAGIAIGLFLAGAASIRSVAKGSKSIDEIVTDLLTYARDTKHDKIIRSCVLAIAFIYYNTGMDSDNITTILLNDNNPIIRYGGVYTIAMAYVGSNTSSKINQLLHVAVADVNSDVRRAAVTCLGFLFIRQPELVPKLVLLLSESFNPHVRYGAAMAIGISGCSYNGNNTKGIEILETLIDDPVDYVRQGSLMALSMLLMQQNTTNSHYNKLKDKLNKIILDKHTSVMTKNGAILAFGILDAGGKNVNISFFSGGTKNIKDNNNNNIKMKNILGMVLFQQHWFWYPCYLFLSLSFSPTVLIGLNSDFKLPKKFTIQCNTNKKKYNYPKLLTEKSSKNNKNNKVITAVLSTTVKVNKKKKPENTTQLNALNNGNKNNLNDKEKEKEKEKNDIEIKENEKINDEDTTKQNDKEKDEKYFFIYNMNRITPNQEKECTFINIDMFTNDIMDEKDEKDQKEIRYVPIIYNNNDKLSGIILLKDLKYGEIDTEIDNIKMPFNEEDSQMNDEAEAPEPFEWIEPETMNEINSNNQNKII